MIDGTGSINLTYSPGRPRVARTKGAINKAKIKLQENKISSRKLVLELDMSRINAQLILRDDLGCQPYKHLIRKKQAVGHQRATDVKVAVHLQRSRLYYCLYLNFDDELRRKLPQLR